MAPAGNAAAATKTSDRSKTCKRRPNRPVRSTNSRYDGGPAVPRGLEEMGWSQGWETQIGSIPDTQLLLLQQAHDQRRAQLGWPTISTPAT